MEDFIEHDGKVIERTDNYVKVMIINASACASCHAKGACTMSDKKEKIIDIYGNYNVSAGDNVVVEMRKELGFPALMIGYVIPLIIVVLSLITMIALSVPEALSGLISLLLLIPYYIILHFCKSQIDKRFTFTIKQ